MFNKERRIEHKGVVSDFMSQIKGVINVFQEGDSKQILL